MFIFKRATNLTGRCLRFVSNFRNMAKFEHEIDTPFNKATFGMGCFWACDALYGGTQGVLRTRVGYAGGTKPDPSYRNLGDHTEVIEIDYNPKVITFKDLLGLFWENHEYGLTTKVKRQYMSLILYHDDEQKEIALKSMKEQADSRNVTLITELLPAGNFYPAEDYHQKYRLQRHPWLCEALGMSPALLQKSHIAARLNGYVAGLGLEPVVDQELKKFGFNEKMIEYVKKQWKSNSGGTLYC